MTNTFKKICERAHKRDNRKKEFGLIVTHRCNLNCKFCIWGKQEFQKNQDIDLKLLENLLIEGKEIGYDFIALTGGEACLHPKFKELIDLIVKYEFRFTIVSNGMLWEKYKFLVEDPKIKKYFCSFAFSLDGSKEIHDKFRCVGCYDKVIEALEFFKDKINVSIKTAVGNHNHSEIMNVMGIAYDLGADFEIFDMICSSLRLRKQEYEQIYKILGENEKLLKKYDKKIEITIMFLHTLLNRIDFCPSLADRSFDIQPDGRVSICCGLDFDEFIIGDLNKGDGIQNILTNKFKKTKVILKGTTDIFLDLDIYNMQMDDRCSLCRHFLKCKKDNGNLILKKYSKIPQKI